MFVCERKQEVHSYSYHETVHYSNMYLVVLWVVWLSCGHMYVTCTVYKHSDITYSTIPMPSLRVKKSLFDRATLYSYLWFTG